MRQPHDSFAAPESFVFWLSVFSPYLRMGELILGSLIAQLYVQLRIWKPAGLENAIGTGLLLAAAASVFAIFHGAGNGILTIARGTLPLAIFGPQNYGYRLGIIGAPARMAQAAAPLVFGLLIDTMGSRILIVSSALSLSALLALMLLRQDPPAP